jgi:hypothetical protein
MSADEVAAAAVAMTAVFESTMHFLGNSIIRLDGDRAHSETYCIAYHRLCGPELATFDRAVGCRIVDEVTRRDDIWKFTKRTYVFEWSRIDEVAGRWKSLLADRADLALVLPHWPLPVGAHRGRRDRSDLAYGPERKEDEA